MGRERLFAVWSSRPLTLPQERLHGAVVGDEVAVSGAYRATRDMAKVKQLLVELPPGEWHAVMLDMEHG